MLPSPLSTLQYKNLPACSVSSRQGDMGLNYVCVPLGAPPLPPAQAPAAPSPANAQALANAAASGDTSTIANSVAQSFGGEREGRGTRSCSSSRLVAWASQACMHGSAGWPTRPEELWQLHLTCQAARHPWRVLRACRLGCM